MSLKDFQILSKLGEGAYSTVHKAKRLIDNQLYAIKKVKMNNLSEKEKENALNEVRLLASIVHPNIIAYKEAFIDKSSNYLYIVMEYADDGDLLDKIRDKSKVQGSFADKEAWSILIQTTQGLKALHDLKILHRDLKSANVFLFKNGMVKLGDLNVSKRVKNFSETQTGTPYYASPEIWNEEPYDKKSDMWSLGCVIYEMLALKPPFKAKTMEGLYKKVLRGSYSRIPGHYSNDFNIVLKMLLHVSPSVRTSCGKIFNKIEKLLEHSIIEKHEKWVENIERQMKMNTELLKTIKLEKERNGSDLKKVDLPKPRYASCLDNYNEDSLLWKKSIASSKEIIRFPSISSRNIEEIQSKKSLKHLNLKTEHHESQVENTKKVTIPKRLKSIDQEQNNRQNKIFSLQNSLHLPGRLKQIPPEIMAKILQKEAEKRKVNSIIGKQ